MGDERDGKGRRVLQRSGIGGGYLACDGEAHFWVVPEYKDFQCLEETPVGPCPGYLAKDSSVCQLCTPRPGVRGKAL